MMYIGSTTSSLTDRFNNHKCKARLEEKKTTPLYVLMNEIGFELFYIVLVCNFSCNNKEELYQE